MRDASLIAFLFACTSLHAAAVEPKVAERWAVLIGVDDYANANDLQFCGADQAALRDRFVTAGFRKENVVLMHDRAADNKYKPSQRNIEQQLSLVISNAEAGDLLVVAFSGHGVSLAGKSYLCPSDARLSDPATLISLDGVYEQLRNCAARFKWVLVDACRNDPTLGGQRSLTATEGTKQLARSLQELKLPEGVVLLNSCAPGEISWEEEKFGHGVYMHYMLEGMAGAADTDGDKAVSLFELQRYASGRTRSYVTGKFNSTQRPFYRSEGEAAALEYALLPVVRGSGATAPKPNAPTAPQPPIVEVPARLLEGGDPIAEALVIARTVAEPGSRSELMRSVAHHQAKLPDLAAAKDTLTEAMTSAKGVVEAEKRSEKLRSLADSFAKLSEAESAKEALNEAASAARSIADPEMRCNQLRSLATAAAEWPDIDAAKNALIEAATAARSIAPPEKRCNALRTVAAAWATLPDREAAKGVFAEAIAVARTISDPKERHFWLAMIAPDQAALPDLPGAKGTLAESAATLRSNFSINDCEGLLWYVVDQCYRIGDRALATEIISELLANSRRISPIRVSFVAKMQANKSTSLTKTDLAPARDDDLEAIRKTFDEAKSMARKSSASPGALLCVIAAHEASVGMEAAARATYDEARRLGNLENYWTMFFVELSRHQVQQGRPEAAMETLSTIGDLSSDDAQSLLAGIAAAHVADDDVESATVVAKQITNKNSRDAALASIVERKIKRDDLSGAFATVAAMSDEFWRQWSFSQIGSAQFKKHDLPTALATARGLSKSAERTRLLSAIGAAMTTKGDAAGEAVCAEALAGIGSPSSDEMVSTVSSIAVALATAEQLKRAYEYAYAVPTPEGKAKVLIAIAAALYEKQHPSAKTMTP